MACEAEYLYGDSTPSPLKTDFISLLRDAVDFAVDALLREAGAADAAEKVARASCRTEKEIEGATKLAAVLSSVLEPAEPGDENGVAARCSSKIAEAIRAILSGESESARGVVTVAAARASQAAASARVACVKALETLLLRRRLPDATSATALRLDGERYVATLSERTSYGLSCTLELDIPLSHAFAQLLRIDQIVERLEVDAPETVGWVRKELRVRPQRLERLYLVELSVDGSSTVIKLRTTPSLGSPGFDLTFLVAPSRVEFVRILQGELAPDEPHLIDGEDLTKLEALRDSLIASLTELVDHPRSLIDAKLDDAPIDKLGAASTLVERLLANIGPMAEEIARRSLVPGELVIKQLLGDNRRQEVFVSKGELREKVRALPQSLWSAFEPLNLWDDAAPFSLASHANREPPRPSEDPVSAPFREPWSHPPEPLAVWTEGPQPPGAGNRRSAFGAESTGKWPALCPAFQE
jgi:hypothetical protein